MDRRALELATKLIGPDLSNVGLYQRIEALTSRGLLTQTLRDSCARSVTTPCTNWMESRRRRLGRLTS
jgi:hypothetical protein